MSVEDVVNGESASTGSHHSGDHARRHRRYHIDDCRE